MGRQRRGRRAPIKIHQASHILGGSDWQTRQLIAKGEIIAWKVGSSWRIDPDSVDRLAHGEAGEQAA